MFLQTSYIALLLCVGANAAIGPVSDLIIANKHISPDGYNRSAVLAGASKDSLSFPGPLITGQKGSTFRMNVIDDLTDTSMLLSTSVHWHGLYQRGSNSMDGPVGVTQCPITPGHSFLYKFSVPDQAGTFWYHSHFGAQYCDGLRGPLVVYDPKDPHQDKYDIDDESTVITLADWYHTPSPAAGLVPAPDSALINGLGRFPGGPASPLTVITVQPNKRYRFRLVSISCDPNFVFSIDGHSMIIIEVDSDNVEPLVVDSIKIYAGQRYSFILCADQPVNNYWIRAMPNAGNLIFDGGVNSAILRYVGADAVDPTTTQQALVNPLVETNLHPLDKPAAPGKPGLGKADVNINLKLDFNQTASKFTVNGGTFTPPPVPVLLQILSGAKKAQELLPTKDVIVLPANKVIEISMAGGVVGGEHPIHLHGHNFAVVRSANSTTYNYANPVRRDVVSIGGAGDNVTIRFETDNVGPWMLHCHIDWHLNMGFAAILAENVPAVQSPSFSHSSDWDKLCPTFDALPTQTFN
ncbi:laccase [Agrocybe pediades]|nr:laccase [Agrocybe pediades]